jgi:hypothetical protein
MVTNDHCLGSRGEGSASSVNALLVSKRRSDCCRPHHVTASDLASQPDAQRQARVGAIPVKIDASSSEPSDPSPLADEGGIIEERRLEGEHIVPSHIASGVDTLEDEKLDALGGGWGSIGHRAESRARIARRPTKNRNQSRRIDSRL